MKKAKSNAQSKLLPLGQYIKPKTKKYKIHHKKT